MENDLQRGTLSTRHRLQIWLRFGVEITRPARVLCQGGIGKRGLFPDWWKYSIEADNHTTFFGDGLGTFCCRSARLR
jgi:hypothetical protein